MGLFGGQQVVGIDIGHSSVKVVGIIMGKKPRFVGCKEITMDPKYLQKEGFANPELIGQALGEAFKSAAPGPIKPTLAYTAISESLVFRKILELPQVSGPDQLMQIIRIEVAEYLPQGIEEMEIDYQLLGASKTDEKLQQVMVVAVAKKVVQDYMAVFAAAKLQVKAIDAKPSALGRAVVAPSEKNPIVLVDVGSEVSTVSLYEHNSIWVTSTLNMGGNIIRDPDTLELVEDGQEKKIERLADGLADEIDHVVKFYQGHAGNGGAGIQELRLTGGGSMIAGLPEALAKLVEFKVVPGQPVIQVPAFCDRRFVGALGSALYPLYEGA